MPFALAAVTVAGPVALMLTMFPLGSLAKSSGAEMWGSLMLPLVPAFQVVWSSSAMNPSL